ncbi:hypothetical protein M409DRAFT_38257 [Zasmidium cellare ATCC 36951]|uniref:Zn(2)-C6 fungal-type domain-containing protein n=1 Tax=Zasmidium cellare ATCC 36951 TaxID=1080233 RepID=A0A6A6BYD3_ZASCE|nr:uncharacterized protein M409DRAFT_38257 [Zasmidium cellare ATCC 36951]KAF2158416.1 hypothetical protein M409DRAFT_38257 [Zasmidium cellare ATCC 36951]
MESRLRTTQRPPRSCTRCARSKIKCDKALPCLQCRSRGLASGCRAETVRSHGRVVTGDVADSIQPSYEDLVKENEKLRLEISRLSNQQPRAGTSRIRLIGKNEELLYQRLRQSPRRERLWNISQVQFPSEQSVDSLLRHGANWTSWLHGAVDQEQFESEVRESYTASSKRRFELFSDPEELAWLGMFFAYATASLLLMTDAEAERCILPHANVVATQQNWYDSALFFLHESQFLRNLHIRNVQTIVILGTCFINFGDFNLYYHLWGCALRMGQALGLQNPNQRPDMSNIGVRLWWSLVMNDWLQIPLQADHSGIDRIAAGVSFPDCNNPSPSVDSPGQYLLILSKLATTLRRLHESIFSIQDDFTLLAAATTTVDHEIALIVSQLPAYLQPESNPADANEAHKWQRENLCIVLLYYRLVINRPSCNEQNNPSASYTNAKAVCLSAAHGIVSSIREFDTGDPITHRRLIWRAYLSTAERKPVRADQKAGHSSSPSTAQQPP